LMKMAAPPGAKVEIESVDAAAEKLNTQAWSNASILFLVRNPIDLLRLVRKGLSIDRVNVGGVRSPEATIKLTKEVSATPAEMEAWKELDKMGIRIEVQFLPNQGSTLLNDVLKKHG